MSAFLADLAGAVEATMGWTATLSAEVARAPWPVPAGLLALGLVELLAGARLRRPVAAVGGAAVGALAAASFREPLGHLVGLSPQALGGVAAALLGGACGAFPPVFPFAAGALPGALAAAALAPESQGPVARAVGALVGGVAGLLLARLVAASVAAALGALAVSLGLAGALARAGIGGFSRHPAAVLAAAAVLAVVGIAFQLPDAWRAAAPRAGEAREAAGGEP
ncbi:MAG TPA: hypothetical protein VMK42_20210 [Anaeromyxobacteraceae bacterium]|nr:hypothetical protein [Anaeromyxobacteraceae bacterium]